MLGKGGFRGEACGEGKGSCGLIRRLSNLSSWLDIGSDLWIEPIVFPPIVGLEDRVGSAL